MPMIFKQIPIFIVGSFSVNVNNSVLYGASQQYDSNNNNTIWCKILFNVKSILLLAVSSTYKYRIVIPNKNTIANTEFSNET